MCETLANHDILWYLSSIIVLSFDHQLCLLMNIFGKRNDLQFFTQERSQEGEKSGFVYAWAEYYLHPNTVVQHCNTEAVLAIKEQIFCGKFKPKWPHSVSTHWSWSTLKVDSKHCKTYLDASIKLGFSQDERNKTFNTDLKIQLSTNETNCK